MNCLFIILLTIWFSFFLSVENLCAQVVSTFDTEELLGQLVSDNEEVSWSMDNLSEELASLRLNPLNVNTATKEQLEQFPFLTDLQIENLLYYCYVTGGMQTIYELQLVDDWDRQTIEYILPFVYVGQTVSEPQLPLKKLFKYGKQELSARVSVPLHTPSESSKWLGNKLYQSFRYGFRSKNQLYFGLTAEKDAGEPFFRSFNKKGYDSYSFYFLLKDRGCLKALALGRYRLRFGMGLVMNMDFGIGKSSSVATLGYKSGGISKHSSTDESNYLQGTAATFQVGKFLLTGFYSFKKQDAIVDNGLITSLKTDGIHRTVLDISKRRKASEQVCGGNIRYNSTFFECGLTGVYNVFNKMFVPDAKPYNLFYPRGRQFGTVGMDYKLRWRKLLFSGEVAADICGGFASLHQLRFSPVSGYQVVLSHRHYTKTYNAWFAASLSEGGMVRGESGFYLAVEAVPIQKLKVFAYADIFRFPWLRYGIDRPSSGFDGFMQFTYTPQRNLSMFLRYQYRNKSKNSVLHPGEVGDTHRHKWRYQLGCELPPSFSLRATVDYLVYYSQQHEKNRGGMLSGQFSYRFQQLPFQLAVHFSFFHTDSYYTRITTYERGMLYTFSFPSFYGKGMRTSLFINYHFNKKLTVLLKVAQTVYKETVEAGIRPRQATVDCQVRWTF